VAKKTKRHPKAGQRRGLYGGVYGLSYYAGGGYLSSQQFGYGYTTAQASEGSGGGSMTTTGGAEGGAGGDGGGAA
jgi:hypothetical protein